ncbi:reverse transcriptase domain-containing protein [Tanacetum coccineum]
MSTRSSARRLLSPIEDPEKLISRRNRSEPSLLFDLEENDMVGQAPPLGPIPDLRSMEELLQAPTDGVGDAIVVPLILANQFELKTVDVFPFSLEGAARTWLEKEPPNSITTWNNLVSKFVNHFFPPSKTTNLRNEITRFQQRFGETFAEAWDRFKDLLNKCPYNGFSPLHQIDTFYNSLSQADQDSFNSAAGVLVGAQLKMLILILSLSKLKLFLLYTDQLILHKMELIMFKTVVRRVVVLTPTSSVKPPVATLGTYTLLWEPLTKGGYNQNQAQSNVPSFEEMMNQHMKMTEARMQQMQEYNNLQLQQLKNHNTNMSNKMDQMQKVFMEKPQGVLPSNTIPNPREDLKAITTQSGVTLAGPSVHPPPLSSSKEVDREPETITDLVLIESTTSVPPSVVQPSPASIELPHVPVSSPVILEPNPHQPSIPYPSRLNKEKLQGKADIQIHSFLQMFKKIHFNISFAEALAHMPKFAKMVKDLLTNKEKLLELANTPLNEKMNLLCLKKRCILENFGEILETLSLPDLSTTRMTLKLATRTVAYPAGIAEDVFIQVGKFTFPTDFVVVDYEVDPRVPLILGRPFLRTAHALVDVHDGDETIHNFDILDITCEDHFHEVLNVQKSINPISGSPTPSPDPVIESLSPSLTPFGDSDFLLEETDAFLSLDDSIPPGIDNGIYDSEGGFLFLEELLYEDTTPNLPPIPHPICLINETEKIKSSIDDPLDLELKDLPPHLEYAFLEGTSKLPIIIAKDLKREEKEQLLNVLKSHKRAIAWKISNIRGIDPNFCSHKILMKDDFKPTVQHQRRVNPKIHEVIKAEFIKLLDAGLIYPISDSPWVSPIHVVPKKEDQDKTTFTCPYGTFAYRRMPFGLCNAPGTFQRCMVAIFHDMIEKTMEVFMDDFSVFGDSFSSCLSHLDMMLKRCEDTNLVLNWEKCHFMVKDGIVLGHKILKSGIEVD